MSKYSDYIARKRAEYGERFDPSGLDPRFTPYFDSGERVRVLVIDDASPAGDFADYARGRVGQGRVEWLRNEEKHLERERGILPLLFTAEDGFDPEGPEVAVMPLSELLCQRSDRGRYAYSAAKAGIKWAKNGAHLGALHDYACREPAAWLLAQDARDRLGRAPSLAPAMTGGR